MAQRKPPTIVIRGVGAHYPETQLSVLDLVRRERPKYLFAQRMVASLGVFEVSHAGEDDTSASLAVEASQVALQDAGWGPRDIEGVASVSCTMPDVDVWSMPAKVAQQLGTKEVECFGLGEAACAGAYGAMRSLLPIMRDAEGPTKVLLCAACMMPGGRFFPPATVFGDGAGAVALMRVRRPRKGDLRVVRADLYSSPEFIDAFGPTAGMTRLRKEGKLEPEAWTFDIRDAKAYERLRYANYSLGERALRTSLDKAGWTADELNWFIPDNVSIKVGPAIAERLGIPNERMRMDNVTRHGHAFAADMFANLHTLKTSVELPPGTKIALFGVGLGQHWGVLLLES